MKLKTLLNAYDKSSPKVRREIVKQLACPPATVMPNPFTTDEMAEITIKVPNRVARRIWFLGHASGQTPEQFVGVAAVDRCNSDSEAYHHNYSIEYDDENELVEIAKLNAPTAQKGGAS